MQDNDNVYDRTYRNVWAPVIIDFAGWTLESAKSDGYDELYYLARDMYPVYHAAMLMYEADRSLPKPRYLEVSRLALRRGEYVFADTDIAGYLCLDGLDVTFRSICKRGALDPNKAEEMARIYGFYGTEDQVLGRKKLRQLRKRLAVQRELINEVRRNARKAYDNAKGYLESNGITVGSHIAIADSGWVGTIQRSIERVGDCKAHGYYMGLYEIPSDAEPDRYSTYIFGPGKEIRRKVRFSNSLCESVISSPKGMTVGYRQTEDGYKPVYADHPNPSAGRLVRNCNIACEMTKNLLETGNKCDGDEKSRIDTLLRLMSDPDDDEAGSYGNVRFCDDISDDHLTEVARIWKISEIHGQFIGHKILSKLRGRYVADSAWPEGSAVRSGARYILSDIRVYKYLIYMRKQVAYKRKIRNANIV